MSLPEVSPASLFLMLGNGEGEKTSVTSGRRCSALLTKSGPLGSLVKTLLESPRWSKEGYSLKWEARGLYSRRITSFTDTNSTNPLPLNESAEILNVQDIASSRCLFRLRLLERPTGETESSSLPMLPTPRAMEVIESPENKVKRLQDRTVNSMPNLQSMAKFRPDLLPTPTAGEAEKYRLQYTPGSQMGTSLSAMGASGMLPTPTAQDFKRRGPNSKQQGIGEVVREMLPTPIAGNYRSGCKEGSKRIQRKKDQGWTIELHDLAAIGGMLPTPRANNMMNCNLTNPKMADEKKSRLEGVIASKIQASSPKTAGGTFRLSPLFTGEMMGFPLGWTELPFLSPSGEQNP